METTTLKQIKEIITNDIEIENKGIELYETILNELKPLEGKTITKKIATQIEKALPDYRIIYKSDYGMFQIDIFNTNTNQTYNFLLGYHTNPIVLIGNPGFESFNTCYGNAARERNEQREKLLADELALTNMADLIDKRNEVTAELEKISCFDCPSWYSIKEIGLKKK